MANIDRLLTFFTQRCNHSRIQKWRQEIENQQAKENNRTRERIAIKTANRDFGRALKSDHSPLKNSAWELARALLKQPAIFAYYKPDENLLALDPVKEAALQVQAAQRHFAAQAKDKQSQAQACGPSQQKTLLKQQAACFADLADALVGAARLMLRANIITLLSENPSLTLKVDDPVVKAYMDYAKFMKKAAKLGLGDDPYIREWHTHHDLRPGSKRIMSKPILAKEQENDEAKEQEIYEAFDSMRHQGYSLRRIHQELMHKKLMAKKSWQAFYKWQKRRNLQELYPQVRVK